MAWTLCVVALSLLLHRLIARFARSNQREVKK